MKKESLKDLINFLDERCQIDQLISEDVQSIISKIAASPSSGDITPFIVGDIIQFALCVETKMMNIDEYIRCKEHLGMIVSSFMFMSDTIDMEEFKSVITEDRWNDFQKRIESLREKVEKVSGKTAVVLPNLISPMMILMKQERFEQLLDGVNRDTYGHLDFIATTRKEKTDILFVQPSQEKAD